MRGGCRGRRHPPAVAGVSLCFDLSKAKDMVTLSRGWVKGQGHQQGVEGSGPRGHVPDWSPVCGRVFVWKGELQLPRMWKSLHSDGRRWAVMTQYIEPWPPDTRHWSVHKFTDRSALSDFKKGSSTAIKRRLLIQPQSAITPSLRRSEERRETSFCRFLSASKGFFYYFF